MNLRLRIPGFSRYELHTEPVRIINKRSRKQLRLCKDGLYSHYQLLNDDNHRQWLAHEDVLAHINDIMTTPRTGEHPDYPDYTLHWPPLKVERKADGKVMRSYGDDYPHYKLFNCNSQYHTVAARTLINALLDTVENEQRRYAMLDTDDYRVRMAYVAMYQHMQSDMCYPMRNLDDDVYQRLNKRGHIVQDGIAVRLTDDGVAHWLSVCNYRANA